MHSGSKCAAVVKLCNGCTCFCGGDVAVGLIELKPCPFCGGKAGLYHTHDGRSCVQCDECGISTLRKMDARLAIQMWNKRDGEKELISKLQAEISELPSLRCKNGGRGKE